jgi:AAA family ATP:ADP antiporter
MEPSETETSRDAAGAPSWIRSVLGDTASDRVRVLGLFAFFFLVIASFWVQKPIRTSRFLKEIGPQALPLVKLGTAMLILPVVLAYSSLAARCRREHMVYLCAATFALCSIGFWWLFSTRPPAWTHYAYFFYVDIFNSVMVALFWSFANDLTSPDQARLQYGFVGAGGIVGGAFGAGLTGWTVEHLGAANLLLVCVAFLAAVAALAHLIVRYSEAPKEKKEKAEASLRDAVAGARLTIGSRYLMSIAAIVMLYEIVSNVIDFQFNTFVAERYHDEPAMAAFLGQFSAASIAASLVAQLVLTTWVLGRWGPRLGLLILPVILGLGSGSIVLVPVFAVVAATFFSDATFSYSLNQSAKEVLYTPTDEATKYQAKAFIDMFLMRLGKAVGSLLILAWIAWISPLGGSVAQLGLVGIVAALAWLAVAAWAGRHFDAQTEAAARGGTVPRQIPARAASPLASATASIASARPGTSR